jgi:hypothetical protein
METLTVIIIGLIGLGLTWFAKWLLGKFKLSLDIQIKVLEIIKKGIDTAEIYAQDRLKLVGLKATSESKLAVALQTIDKLAKEHPEVLRYLQGKKEELVERMLNSTLTDEELNTKK